MLVKEYAKNGQATQIIKEYSELTSEELDNLTFPANNSKEDFANYFIFYNKKGELVRVTPHVYADSKVDDIEDKSTEPDAIDAMKLLYGNDAQKAEAKKVYTNAGMKVTGQQIKAAKRVLGENK